VSGVRKLAVSLVIGATPVTWHGDWNLLGHSLSKKVLGLLTALVLPELETVYRRPLWMFY